ncbi:MAG: hypothetical protein JWL77_2309 [Chthonomonadaceae bacterium]|nr:hypothetical protein [Chthonomonadaceae bacterium]
MSSSNSENRRVVLIKSLHTNNRFYALVEPDRGIRNADAIANIPDDLLLGIAYPCLEDGLNDFAVIRTTFETLDLFPDDDPIREEMMEIVNDARGNLLRRLHELHDKIANNKAHFLGTDYDEFKSYAMNLVHRGYPRRNLDNMMKLNVFSSVAETEGLDESSGLNYFFQFQYIDAEALAALPARQFIVGLLAEVIRSVQNDSNYTGKYPFDKNVFQKFIAVMFVNYATTNPMFYGINKGDYGVSTDKDMDATPLYMAIAKELLEIEARLWEETNPFAGAPVVATPDETMGMPDFASAPPLPIGDVPDPIANSPSLQGSVSFEQAGAMLPNELINEEVLLGPITSLCSAAQLLMRKNDPETQRFARVILADASKLVDELKRLGIVSRLANDPGAC